MVLRRVPSRSSPRAPHRVRRPWPASAVPLRLPQPAQQRALFDTPGPTRAARLKRQPEAAL